MAPDHFAVNFAIFAGGCAAALAWLRTGMVVRGALLLVVLFVAADVALVARFVFGDPGGWFFAGLFAMQVPALAAILWWAVRLAVRHWSRDRRARRQLFAAGLQHYLRNEHQQAEALFRRLHRVDPWDVPAAIGLANVLWRRGQGRRARRLLRAARRLDRHSAYSEFIAEQLRRLGSGAAR